MSDTNSNKRKFNKTQLSVGEPKVEVPREQPVEPKKKIKLIKKEKIVVSKKEEAKIEKELEAIYKNSDGSMPDMGDFEKQPKHSLKRAFVLLTLSCLFFAGVIWVGFFMFNASNKFQEEQIVLEIVGEKEVMAGSLVHYRLRYQNGENVPLTKANLEVRYPEGFVFKEASRAATDDKNSVWQVGSVGPGQSGYVDIYGYLFGNLNQEQSLRVFFNYIPSNFSSEFQKVNIFNSKITSSPIVLSVISPENITAGSKVEFVINLSKPEEIQHNIALVMDPGGNFNKLESDPKSDANNNYAWNFAELKDEQKIIVRGTFNPSEEKIPLKFILKVYKNDKSQEDGYVWQENILELPVLKTELSANLAINGTMNDFAVTPGETLNTSIVLKNSGSTPLKNLQVRLIFETPSFNDKSLLNWQELNDPADGVVSGEKVNEQTRRVYIVWSKKHLPSLSKLGPNQEINIDLSVPLKNAEQTDLTAFASSSITAMLEIKYENNDGQKMISTEPIKMTVNSDLTFTLKDQISTNNKNQDLHLVNWILNNSFHELKDLELTADFYGDIAWQTESLQVPAGEAKFDETNKKLTWKIVSLPTSLDVLALQFGILQNTKNPSQTNLASKVSIKATDVATGQQIILAGDEIKLP